MSIIDSKGQFCYYYPMNKDVISKGDVVHIAKLARLELTEQEVEKMQKDLSSILDYFTLLQKAGGKKLGKIEKEVLPLEKVMREDTVIKQAATNANNLVKAAPVSENGYIKVKQILQ